MLVFYQVFAVRESVYGFSLPEELTEWLSAFAVLSFDIGSFFVPSWSCAGGLTASLAFNGLAPLVLMAVVALVHIAREAAHKGVRPHVIRIREEQVPAPRPPRRHIFPCREMLA